MKRMKCQIEKSHINQTIAVKVLLTSVPNSGPNFIYQDYAFGMFSYTCVIVFRFLFSIEQCPL